MDLLRPIVFPWPGLLLGTASLSLGGVLGALGSRLPWTVVEKGLAGPTGSAVLLKRSSSLATRVAFATNTNSTPLIRRGITASPVWNDLATSLRF